jgi:hypothetical protein
MTHFTPLGLGGKKRPALAGGARPPSRSPLRRVCAHEMGQYQRSVVLAGRGYSAPAARAVIPAWRRRMVSGQRDLM